VTLNIYDLDRNVVGQAEHCRHISILRFNKLYVLPVEWWITQKSKSQFSEKFKA